MTAPTINGVRYPQPVEALLPAARHLAAELGEVPSRNRLMREFRIGAPKADDLRARLTGEADRQAGLDRMRGQLLARGSVVERVEFQPADEQPADPWDYAEPIGPNPPITDDEMKAAVAAAQVRVAPAAEPVEQVTAVGHPDTPAESEPRRPLAVWPVILLALPAFVAIWSGWVELGELAGFGVVHPLPGIADGFSINSAITLPIGVEAYGAYASYVWLSGRASARTWRYARASAIASLLIGALGQVAYHLLAAAGVTAAPWWVTTAVSCLPVVVFGMGAMLAHLVREDGKRA
ncbi:ABC transporter permease [Micromonospora globbae]|uniref:ABC transporter permease n=1 Tax=Micromonospora globbae TaxID=1894969 RepID=UPI003426BF94